MPGNDLILAAAAILATGTGVAFGPVRLTCRAVLRGIVPPDTVRRWQSPATYGVQVGLVMAVILAAVQGGPDAAALTAVVSLLVLLATLDIAWRWLPFAWTIPLLILAIIMAMLARNVAGAAAGAAMGAGLLWGLQLFFRHVRGVEALGTGDIWLTAGLGALTGPQQISLILGLAAVTGLIAEVTRQRMSGASARRRMGVAYGAHLCLAYIIVYPF